MAKYPRIIEVKMPIDLVEPKDAIQPTPQSRPENPVSIEIAPVVRDETIEGQQQQSVTFRVAFEPNNEHRRQQPLRPSMDSEFPYGWEYGKPWPVGKQKK